MPKPSPALPPDITVTFLGRDRFEVAEALRNQSRAVRDQYQGRRAKTEFGKYAHEKADRLWRLAQQIDW